MRALILGLPKSVAERRVGPLCDAAGIEWRALHPRFSLRGRGSAMSVRDYQARFGDDIDFAAAALIVAEAHRGFSHASFLELDSPFYRRMRGVAAEIDEAISGFRPDVVLAPGFTAPAQIITAKALRRGAAPLFWEPPIVPGGAFILDRRAPHFIPRVNALDAEWDDIPSSEADRVRGGEYVAQWRAARDTKTPSGESQSEVRRLTAFLHGGQPVLLLALQVISDMNVLMQLPPGFDGDYPAWVDAVLASVPEYWKVVVKKHPRTWFAPRLTAPNHFAADQVDIHRLFDRCDCTLTLASNMGMEAALAGIPSIVCGRPFYSGRGITTDFAGDSAADYAANLQSTLDPAPTRAPHSSALNRFAHRALLEYHFWPDDSAKFRALLENARDCPADVGDPRRPFFEFWPRRLRRYSALVNEYAALGLSRPAPGEIAAHWLRRRTHAWSRSLRKRLPTT